MRKILSMMAMSLFLIIATSAQSPLKTRSGHVQFNANKHNAPDYVGTCTDATAVFNPSTGKVALLIPGKSIHFPNALLEDHVNENYLQTDKYPNITFNGIISKYNASILQKDGTYTVSANGTINMHGVDVPFQSDKIIVQVKGKTITFKVDVNIDYNDFKIAIPSTVEDKIARPIVVKANIPFNM